MSDELYGTGFNAGFAAGKAAMDTHYRALYSDDFEEFLKKCDIGFKGLFDEEEDNE